MQQPTYNLQDFLNDCKNHKEKVLILRKPFEDAQNLNLETHEAIKNFLGNLNVSDFEFVNSIQLRNGNYHPKVDAYHIKYSIVTTAYIAFYIAQAGDKWVVKSFHRDDSEQFTLGDLLKKGDSK